MFQKKKVITLQDGRILKLLTLPLHFLIKAREKRVGSVSLLTFNPQECELISHLLSQTQKQWDFINLSPLNSPQPPLTSLPPQLPVTANAAELGLGGHT